MVSKRVLLSISIGLCFIMLSGCMKKATFSSPSYEIVSGEELTFFIVSDPHYISKRTYDENEAFENFCCSNDGKLLNYADEIMDTFIWEVSNKRPDFLIVSGDLSCNGEKESHLDFAKKLEDIENQGTCVYVIPGNHDIDNPWAGNYIGKEPCKAESITTQDFSEIYNSFGYDEAISRDEHSLSYLVMPSKDLWLLMLDSTKKNDSRFSNAPEINGMISPETLKWIEQCSVMAKENNAQLIASMHHSLLPHNSVINKGYVIDNSLEVINVFQELGIEVVLTGHIHLQSIKSHIVDDYRLYDIATGSILAYPNLYGELKYCPNSGFEYNSHRIDVENWALNNKIEDENMSNFNDYSLDYFENRSFEKYYAAIAEKLSDAEKDYFEIMAKTVAKLNLGYFKGLRNAELVSTVSSTEYNMLISTLPD
ncbi:metallophosphoesterase [Proteiniborus sp. MB09-C3]|uniref:metallophosphoesterase n=1 Tax=Proteiniborus sp. MB09-C3 TaxID=3050072 RepID=UPI002556451D|nr:metallophosphoesterase [Proteiniborus sp. MB09-C3]WIV11502.1 metallophosphoesterase [Proteiniborus sp. MB09-C3]